SNKDFNSFNMTAPRGLSGRILLKVEDKGQAYYVSTSDFKMHYLGRPVDAFKVMREQGLGITDENLNKILLEKDSSIGKFTEEPKESPSEEATLSDLGDFKIIYGETQNPRYAGLNKLLEDSRVFENVADFLNLLFILQKAFPITFKECGFVNAYYSLETKEIVLCDELLENFAQNFIYFVSTEDELDKAITDATFFIFFHELGHGLTDIYNLTYSGREEDVADQLATVALANLGEDGVRAAITGANMFYITSSQIDAGSYPFWDEHSLNQQRYYNILCWVHGSNPEKYNDFVGIYGLPEERAVRCQREYEKMSEFWDVAIYPYLQEEIKKEMNK
ncbi:MAG: DUF4344 domain-containing metallopeptidase, partial [Patescibacteria group bacterium]